MDYLDAKRLLNLDIPRHVEMACLYLQAHGLRFCVDYGYQNAIDKAARHSIDFSRSLGITLTDYRMLEALTSEPS